MVKDPFGRAIDVLGTRAEREGEDVYLTIDHNVQAKAEAVLRSFDGQGNYSLGVREQIIFPEIAYDAIDQVRGMDITITTTAKDNKQGRALLEAFNFPFRR